MKHTALVASFIFLTLMPINSHADTRIPFSATGGVRNDYDNPNSAISVLMNLGKMWSGALSKEDKSKHIGAVIFALENAEEGQVVEWYSPNEESSGKIKVLYTYMVQGGHCRKIVSLIKRGEQSREYEEVGCRTIDSQFWSFARR